MRGRIEHQIENENRMRMRLIDAPSYVEDYYNGLMVNNMSHQSIESYITYLFNFLNFMEEKGIDISNPRNFTTREITAYFADKRYVVKRGELHKTSGSYKATVHSALKSFFTFCSNSDLVDKIVLDNIKRATAKNDTTPQDYLTMEEVNKVLQAIEDGVGNARAKGKQKKWKNRDKCIFLLMITTGIRITALTEIDVWSFNEDYSVLTYVDKGDKATQALIPESVRPYLEKWSMERYELLNYDMQVDPFFISNQKTRITQKGVSHIIEKYVSVLGEDRHITPHRLRASFAINLYESTKDIKLVCDCMNHSNITTTSHYVKPAKTNRQVASNVFENALVI